MKFKVVQKHSPCVRSEVGRGNVFIPTSQMGEPQQRIWHSPSPVKICLDRMGLAQDVAGYYRQSDFFFLNVLNMYPDPEISLFLYNFKNRLIYFLETSTFEILKSVMFSWFIFTSKVLIRELLHIYQYNNQEI